MSFKVIDPEAIDVRTLREKYPPPPQYGPLRFHDKGLPCMAGTKGHRCGSQAFHTVKGIRYCMKHALFELNDIICQLTGEGRGLNADGSERQSNSESTECVPT